MVNVSITKIGPKYRSVNRQALTNTILYAIGHNKDIYIAISELKMRIPLILK